MTAVTDPAPQPGAEDVDRNLAMLCYGLLFLAIFLAGVPALVAVAIAYARRDQANPLVASHHRFQIFVFWVGVGLTLLAALSGLAAVVTFIIRLFDGGGGGTHWSGVVAFGGVAVALGLITGAWLMTTSVFGFIRLASAHTIGQTAR